MQKNESTVLQIQDTSPEGINDTPITIKQFCSKFTWPSESAMRAYVFKAEDMGITPAFTRVGRRVLVLPKKFFSLIQQIDKSSKEGEENETKQCTQTPRTAHL